jgi:hypothetical protein
MIMKLLFFFLGSICFYCSGYSRSIIIKGDSLYGINTILTKGDPGKYCLLINCFSKSDRLIDGKLIRPLILIKCFFTDLNNYKNEVEKNQTAFGISLNLYAEQIVIPNLLKDLAVNIKSFHPMETLTNDEYIDTVIFFENNKYYTLSGTIFAEFYNVIPFEQKSILQSNTTLINVNSLIPKSLFGGKVIDPNDKVPPFLIDGTMESAGKILLLKRINSRRYKFCRIPNDSSDDPHIFYSEFLFDPDKGVVGLYSKFIESVEYMTSEGGKIVASKGYYNFLPVN